jgi:hypothetical protein
MSGLRVRWLNATLGLHSLRDELWSGEDSFTLKPLSLNQPACNGRRGVQALRFGRYCARYLGA